MPSNVPAARATARARRLCLCAACCKADPRRSAIRAREGADLNADLRRPQAWSFVK